MSPQPRGARPAGSGAGLTVAVTGPTGEIGKPNRGPLDPVLDQLMAKQKISFTRALTHNYPAGSYVSSALIAGDLFDSNVQPRRSVERVAKEGEGYQNVRRAFGILLGDSSSGESAYVEAYGNHVVSTTNYGIAISAGHDLEYYNHRIFSAGVLLALDGLDAARHEDGHHALQIGAGAKNRAPRLHNDGTDVVVVGLRVRPALEELEVEDLPEGPVGALQVGADLLVAEIGVHRPVELEHRDPRARGERHIDGAARRVENHCMIIAGQEGAAVACA